MWGGVECTVNRVRDDYFTQLDRSGHAERDCDLDRFAALGIRVAPLPGALGDDRARRPGERRLVVGRPTPAGPARGSASRRSSAWSTTAAGRATPACSARASPTGLAEFAGAVAARFPWVEHWTPVNEPLTTARFSALYGLWYPHARDDRSFVAALLNQCRATVLSMQAIRRVNPAARLVQTDDISRTYGTER